MRELTLVPSMRRFRAGESRDSTTADRLLRRGCKESVLVEG